jgi:hypothetical protein
MKKIIPFFLSAVLLMSCGDKEWGWQTAFTYTYSVGSERYPYKAAVIDPKMKISIDDTGGFAKSLIVDFSDSCSDNVETSLKFNGVPYISFSECLWSLEIDSIELSHDKNDTLQFDITYSGKSKRYGWDYSRRTVREMVISRRDEYYVLSLYFPKYYGVHFVNLSIDNDSILLSDQMSENHSFYESIWQVPGHRDILFIPSGGNQIHLVVTWPEGQEFDNITLWYGNHLLNNISDNGWQKRYYLDEFPLGKEMYLQVAKGDKVKRFPIAVEFGDVQ